MPKTTEERFWEKVVKVEGENGCWLWVGSKRSKGYGAFVYARDGEVVQGRAHRYSYELHVGPIPEGANVLHNCPGGDNPACVNPAHLWLGTIAENNADMIAKGRRVKGGTYKRGNYERGTSHHNARITPEMVREIRRRYEAGESSYSQLSKEYGLATGHVHRIVNRKAWRDVE